MNEKEVNGIYHLFYLSRSSRIDETYVRFSKNFSSFQIQLVPITLDQLKTIDMGKTTIPLIYVDRFFSDRTYLDKALNGYLSILLKRRLVKLYHISSFGEHFFFKFLKSSGIYRYLGLPDKISLLSAEITKDYYRSIEVGNLWPGGKKARLPEV